MPPFPDAFDAIFREETPEESREKTCEEKVAAPEMIAKAGTRPSADISRYRFPLMATSDTPSDSGNRARFREAMNRENIPGDHRIRFSTLRHIIRSIRQRDHRRQQQAGFATGYQEGYQEGYQAGLKAGRQAGLDEAARQQAKTTEQWLALSNALWQELQNLHTTTLEQLGQPLVELVTRVAQQVINHELSLSRQSLLQLIEQSLELLPDTDGLVIMIHPDDQSVITPVTHLWPDNWTLQEDKSLTPGGCRIVAPRGEVDGRVETRLDACLEPVRKMLTKP